MGYIIGIDVGGSTTKVVGYLNGKIISPIHVRADDPLASVYGAFGRFISINQLQLADIEQVMLTGVGSSFLAQPIYGIPTGIVDEFVCNGLGGLELSGEQSAVIVSMGTGTSFVRACGETICHLGGSGVGGGTLLGLSSRMLNVTNFDSIVELAQTGDLSRVDLTVGDISRSAVSNLSSDTTASNFGKVSDLATKNDLALGIINMVFQTAGLLGVFAARETNDKIVLIGALTRIPQCRSVFDLMENLFGCTCILPEHAEFATALGAAIAFVKHKPYQPIPVKE